MNLIKTLEFNSWNPSVKADMSTQITDALEQGYVIALPQLAFELLPEEQKFLSEIWADKKSKNISLRPRAGLAPMLKGAIGSQNDLIAIEAMIARYTKSTVQLINALLPSYVSNLQLANTSFRPLEVQTRVNSYHKDDTRLHVDAFPSNPTQGTRLLRVFNNINPYGKPRVWRVGEPFAIMAEAFLPKTRALLPMQAWLMQQLRMTKKIRTEYDQRMLQLHDLLKADLHYQQHAPQQWVNFMPGTTWIVYSDQVLHAAMAGQFMLEQTFSLPVHGLKSPETAPLKVLERMLNKTLAPLLNIA